MLTRRHFIALAAILRDERRAVYEDPARVIDSIEKELMRWCASENPAFDRDRFLEASHGHRTA